MINSMTGFGSAESVTDQYTLSVEIKTLNSKFFDPIMKLPKEFAQWELPIKSVLENGLKRGKINLTLDFEEKGEGVPPVSIDEKLFENYFKIYQSLAEKVGVVNHANIFTEALHSPEVLVPKELEIESIPFEQVKETIQKAIDSCNGFRKNEGKKLEDALKSSLYKIANCLEMVKKLDPDRIEGIKSRLQQSINEIKNKVQLDQNRFEQEVVYYIEKLDITEEKVRLKSHLDHFSETLLESSPHGKKLGFIAQEIGREINTIGSKANDSNIQKEVVVMKEELEKIKEQVLNVL